MVEREQALKDDADRPIARVGDTVVRPAAYWTPAVHGLLAHLEAVGFAAAPRVLCRDERGREILTFLPGSSGPDGWGMVVPESGLVQMAQLLRAYHDAVRDFRPPEDTAWATTDRPLRDGEVICHNDFYPCNLVWRDGRPVGIIDWDLAGPGDPLIDVAYALEYTAPFRDDGMALRWLRYQAPPDRRRRIEVFAEAYGLPSAVGLVDRVIDRQRQTIDGVRAIAEHGVQPQVRWVESGYLDELERRADWSERHRSLFE